METRRRTRDLPFPVDLLPKIADFLPTQGAFNLVFCCRTTLRMSQAILRGRVLEAAWCPYRRVRLEPETLRRCLRLLGRVREPQGLIDASPANLAVLRDWGLTLANVRSLVGVLSWAAKEGHVDLLLALRAWGLTIDDVRSSYNQALHYAVSSGQVGALRVLREWGLTGDDAREFENLALRVAVVNGDAHVVRELRGWGLGATDARACDNEPLRMAARLGHLRVLQELRTWGLTTTDARARGNEAMRSAIAKCHAHVVIELARWGLRVPVCRNDNGPLIACKRGQSPRR